MAKYNTNKYITKENVCILVLAMLFAFVLTELAYRAVDIELKQREAVVKQLKGE